MNPWLHEAASFLKTLLGGSPSIADWALFGGVVTVSALVMMKLMGLATGNARATWLLNLVVFVMASLLMLAAVVAGRLWAAPRLEGIVSARALDWVCVALGLFVLATPVFCLLQRVRYLTALMTLLVAGFTAGFAYLFAASAIGSASKTGELPEAVRQRAEDVTVPLTAP